MKKSKLFACMVLPIFMLTGCNTIRGLGADIIKIGNSIQNSANKVSQNRSLRQQQNNLYYYNNTNNSGYNNSQHYSGSQYYDPYYSQNLPQPTYNNNYN